MSSPSKKKGTAAETRVLNYLKTHGLDARRVVLKGARDEGDIHFTFPVPPHALGILEVKSGRQTSSVSRKQRHEWLLETRKEAHEAETCLGYLVVAKHGSPVQDYLVWSMDGHKFWYLDEFIDWLYDRERRTA